MENTTPAPPTTQVHLLIRDSGEFEDTSREVIAALTDAEQAGLLMRTREQIEGRDDVSYEIQTLQVHPSAAAALGLA